MMKTGKNNRFLASILAASMMLTMSPFAFAAADTAEQKEMTTQEQVQSAPKNETNANPTVSQTEDQSSEDTNSEALKTKGQSSENTNSEASKTEGQPSEDVKPAGDSTSASKTPAESENPTESETPAEPETPKKAAKIGEDEYPTVAAAGSVQLLPAAPVEETGAEENALTPVPAEKLIFDQGVIKGIDATWLAENKDKPLSVAIPAEINGVAVTTIGIQAFQKCKNLICVDLSGTSITVIQKRAFYECTALKEVILPDSLKILGNTEVDGQPYTAGSIFYGCSNMESIRTESSDADATFELPANLTAIGKHTFYGCFKNDVKVVIPESVKEIEPGAFYYKGGSVDHITQIVLKSTDVSGYNTEAFNFRSGSSRMLVFANKTAYDNYNSRPVIKKAMTYPVEITFTDTAKTELHLNGKSLKYQQDNTTGFWELNDAYALPTAPGSGTPVDPKPGYEYVTGGGWKLTENDEVLDVTKDLKADTDKVTAVSGGGKYELLAPTISYLVDGKSKPVDADQPFTVTIGDGKEHSIGIQVDHPLLKEKQGTDKDYVYFEYYWFDEVALGNGQNTLNGPRSKEEPERFSTASSNVDVLYVDGKHNTIPITKAEHARYDGSSYKGYNDYYLVVVFGYHVVNGDKINTPFYLSANNGIGTGNANVTDGPHLLQVNVDEVRIITATAGDNGKITPAGEVAVPKGKNQTFKITPNEGYHIQDVKVDRESVGAVKEYTFKDVTEPHTIHATFARNSSGGGGGSHKPTVTIPDDVPTGLNGDDHYAYIVGYPDSTVRPQNGITRAEVATIFFRLLTDETRNANSTKSNSYSDVAAGAWYNHAVSTLSAMGIVKGDSQGKFNPNAPITRAEFAAIAARFDDKANTTAVDFSDIASHWAKNEISAAANNGWINGYTDGTFRPNNKITRAEAMTLVNRVLKRLPETAEDLHNDMIKWSDNSDTSAWYYLAVQEATNSHYYDLKENKHEKWSKLRETRDWTELEK